MVIHAPVLLIAPLLNKIDFYLFFHAVTPIFLIGFTTSVTFYGFIAENR